MRWRANRSYSPSRSDPVAGADPVVVHYKTLTSGRKLNRLTSGWAYHQQETSPARSATHVVCLRINSSHGYCGPVEAGQSFAITTGELKAVSQWRTLEPHRTCAPSA